MYFSFGEHRNGVSVSGGETDAGKDCGKLVCMSVQDGDGSHPYSCSPAMARAIAEQLIEAAKAAEDYDNG